jgi:hypothetical protein
MAEPAPAAFGVDPASAEAAERAIEQWKIKKLIKSLEQARGCDFVDVHILPFGTVMEPVSVIRVFQFQLFFVCFFVQQRHFHDFFDRSSEGSTCVGQQNAY